MNFNKGLSNGNIKQTIQSILAGTMYVCFSPSFSCINYIIFVCNIHKIDSKCPRRTNCNGYFMVNGRSGMNRGLSNDNESIISGINYIK